jgi:hypothetical protein
VDKIEQAVAKWMKLNATGGYYDTHNYKFVPTSLNSIMRKLDDLGLTDLRVHRLYPSKYGSIEFVVVLKKGGARGAERRQRRCPSAGRFSPTSGYSGKAASRAVVNIAHQF